MSDLGKSYGQGCYKELDSDSTESNKIKIPVLNQSTTEFYEEEEEEKIDDEDTMDEEEDDEVIKELYDDVNVNVKLGNEDTKMTNADQGASKRLNVSQELRFKQVEEDAHVTLTPVLYTHKADEPVQSSYVSFDFTSKLLNLKNPSLDDNEIASLLDTTTHHATTVLEITSSVTITIPPPPPLFNPLSQQATPTPTPTASKTTTSLHALPDFTSVFKFNDRVTNLERDLSELKQVDKEEVKTQLLKILPKAVSDFATHSTYEAAASLSKYELTKILLDKMKESKSHLRADYKKKLYDALVESYNTEKDIFESYGEVFSLKRSQDEKDKDQDPSAGSDRGTKRRKSKDPSHTVDDSGVKQDQEFGMGNNDEQPTDKEATKDDWFKKPKQPPTPDLIGIRDNMLTPDLLRPELVKLLMLKNLILHLMSLWIPLLTSLHLTSSKDVYSRKRIIAVTRLLIMEKYDYDYLEEIEVRREDQKLYNFIEGDFPRLRLQDIKDMLLLLVQQKLTNLIIDEQYALNVALRMFTRQIVIQRRVEDLQLSVESYQNKLNLTKPDTFRSDLRNMTTYTAYSNPKGVINKDQMNKNRLMRADELHIFSDGTLDDVRSALNDIAKGIRMEYRPKKKWSDLNK
nr:hypothetical protein [Tanacetum cinerariifolium]